MKLFGLNITKSKRRQTVSRQQFDKLRVQLQTELHRMGKRSYDAAATHRHNIQHWLYADNRDADSIIAQDLPTLRNRCRYEVRNNSYAKGIVDTKANDTIGTGPRLQITTDDSDIDKIIEDKFSQWCADCDLGGKLSFADIIRLAGSEQLDESGESFIILQNSFKKQSWLDAEPYVSLKLLVIEPDRVQTPMGLFGTFNEKVRNGIEIDEFARPLYYYILKKHPGALFTTGISGDYDKVPAADVIHLYRQDRPGQTRGVPWLTPALGLFAQLRRYTLAVLSAAEQVANISGVLESELSGTEEDVTTVGDEIEIPRGSLIGLPGGAKLAQIKSEQPSSTYKDFKQEILNEIGRCLNMPFNVVAANSATYNYASGRLDWQIYFRAIRTNRAWIERVILNRIFYTWLREAMLIPGYLPRNIKADTIVPSWFWPGAEHVDPVKEATAQKVRLLNQTTTLAAEFAAQGKDWERELRQRAKEIELQKELGLIDEGDAKKAMEDIARAVRAGVPIAVSEARTAMGLPEEMPEGQKLRFNDQDVLQYHIENGILTINEVRKVLGLGPVPWGNVPIRKKGVSPVGKNGEDGDEDETETESRNFVNSRM